ncbi:L-aspartate oxidase [Gulosibacter molinativorax]|uniref:L-aspartate oxidase n=1 Tax=Gulosibacter molinativorax TaxID=256821 RepID=A0ABT7C4C4_9MICO|nr:FAD-dependent oxidoreductase [Gulosibacter molinativorax]MDJ1370067.1 FAD-binding protein [Gulosibacter molinativorax]
MTRTVLVVGSGIAGLTAARHAREAGHDVLLVTKRRLEDGCTVRAQGGIGGTVFPDDSVASHVHDTLVAGAGHCDPEAVQVLCESGAESIHELAREGVQFDTDEFGQWCRGLEGAHSIARIVHAGGDATGARIHEALVTAARRAGVRFLEHRMLRELIVRDGRAVGARFSKLVPIAEPVEVQDVFAEPVEVLALEADAVILATGGYGGLYPFTTNPDSATGDGIVIAARAGAELADLEFMQFHPTVLAVGEPFLISEAVRGEGATLVDETGYRFMLDIDPRAELAPRDIVARAIAAQGMPGSPGAGESPSRSQSSREAAYRGVPLDTACGLLEERSPISREAAYRGAEGSGRGAFLDATQLGRDFLASRFPTIDAALKARGLDWSREPIPVQPAAHFAMGGISTDLWGKTTVPGLYAVGEVARTGVHGANRLASNSLLEGAVFGARVALAIGMDANPSSSSSRAAAYRDVPLDTACGLLGDRRSPLDTACGLLGDRDGRLAERGAEEPNEPFSRAALQQLMWRNAGLIRTAEGLGEAEQRIHHWQTTANPQDPEDQNLLELAALVTQAALQRTESKGAHFRADATTANTTLAPTH